MVIDPKDYPNTGGKYLEPGEYVVRIKDAVYKKINDKEAVEFIFADDFGASVKDAFYLTKNAMWRIIRLSEACGVNGKFKPEDLCGKVLKIKVDKESKDGKMYSRLKDFGPANGETMDPGRDDAGFEAYDKQKNEDPF
jgi:hypothetical protein